MVTVSRRALLPLLASILAPTVCLTLASNPVPTGGTASFPDTSCKQGVRHDLSRAENYAANERRSYLKLQCTSEHQKEV
jgi:hypothetical protein